MNFFIVSIAVLCVSAISANPTKEGSQFTRDAADTARRVVFVWEMIAGLNPEASLQENVINIGKALAVGSNVPEWNPDISAKDNLEKYIMLTHMQDKNATVTENVKLLIEKFIDIFPVPKFFSDSLIEPKLIRTIKELIKERMKLDSYFNKSLEQGIENWLSSLSDLKVSRPEDIVGPALEKLIDQIPIRGFTPENTLQDNVAAYVKYTNFCY